jgi:speckle-type POZ protein
MFKVDNAQAKRLPTGKAVHSDAIPAGGHTWRINFYPGGMRATTDRTLYDRHCIALELLTSDKVGGGVAAVFDVMVLDDQGQPARSQLRAEDREDEEQLLRHLRVVVRPSARKACRPSSSSRST